MSFPKRKLYRGFLILVSLAATNACTTPSRPFDSTEWKQGNATTRGAMSADLINRRLLIGKSRVDVESLLGKPDRQDADTYDYKVITVARCRYVWECRLGVIIDQKSGLVTFVAVND